MTDPTGDDPRPARLTLGHLTLPARDLDALVAFYRDVLGFHVTDRGSPGPDAPEMAFLSQDPAAHHQIVLVEGVDPGAPGFVMVDHVAFRADTLDDLRRVHGALAGAGVEVIPICHGNSWSLYFSDPEGNGLECFVDTPYHVTQPFAEGLDLGATDDEILEVTRALVEPLPGSRSIGEWRADLAAALGHGGR